MTLPTLEEVIYACASDRHFLETIDDNCGSNLASMNLIVMYRNYPQLTGYYKREMEFFIDYVINIGYLPILRAAAFTQQ